MLKFHIIIIKFSIFNNKNSQSDTFFPKLRNTIVKIDIKSFSVCYQKRVCLKLYVNLDTFHVLCNIQLNFFPTFTICTIISMMLRHFSVFFNTVCLQKLVYTKKVTMSKMLMFFKLYFIPKKLRFIILFTKF